MKAFRSGLCLLTAAVLIAGCSSNGGGGVVPGGASPQGSNLVPDLSMNAGPTQHYGVVPMLGTELAVRESQTLEAISSNDLHYRGGTGGVGVTSGQPKVYLVFYGSQWGTQGKNSAGYVTFTGDPAHMAPYENAMFAGLGTNSEKWSAVMTQYCDGTSATVGATKCTSTANHIPYPSGTVVAGIWEDTSVKSPAAATANQLAAEAEKAATHFGNTTAASNRYTQYLIISPHGTDPNDYKTGGFCAWHDYTGDGYTVTGPLLAFTNMPYITDVGSSCGANFVNSGTAGALDGVSIVAGHEYAETLTDQFPAGGWTANSGAETGDLCAWKTSGAGKSQDVTFATGTFAMQGTWSNLANKGSGGCVISGPIVL
jgi:hypothetical protein